MTVTATFPNRGDANPDTRSDGREANINNLVTAVNALTAGTVSAETYFDATSETITVNKTLTTLPTTYYVTPNNAGLSITLPSASGEDTVFDGGIYTIVNASKINSVIIKDNGGTKLSRLGAGETGVFLCIDDSTAAGTWFVSDSTQSYLNLLMHTEGML